VAASSPRRSPPRRSLQGGSRGSGSWGPRPSPPSRERLEAFRQRLRALGYMEGTNLVIDYRRAEGHYERLPALASELAGSR